MTFGEKIRAFVASFNPAIQGPMRELEIPGPALRQLYEAICYFVHIPVIVATLKLLKNITFDHLALSFKKRERTDVTTEVDERVALDDSRLADYLSVFSFVPLTLMYLKREFGYRAVIEGARLLKDLACFYADGGKVFRLRATTFRRSGEPGPAVTFLREIDRVQNVFPSLHIAIAVHTYARAEDVIDAYAYDVREYAAMKECMFHRTVTIIESTLLLKQHGWRDIAGGLVAVSARNHSFTKERAEKLIDGLFRQIPVGMAENDVQAVRDEIKALYGKLMREIASRPEVDFTQVLIDYVKNLEEEAESAT